MKTYYYALYTACISFALNTMCHTPDITIVLVVDQCSFETIRKVRPYLKGGLRFLLDEGIQYNNAYVPYAWPGTAPGHTSLSTGALPKDHGIIANHWSAPDSREINCDDGGEIGSKSACNIMVDTISDQVLLQNQRHKSYRACSVSYKSRAAICTAGKLGTPFWFDNQTGMFVTNKIDCLQQTSWLAQFNKTHKPQPYTWHLHHTCMRVAYDFTNTKCYAGCAHTQSLIGTTIAPQKINGARENIFAQTPQANQLVFDAALACLRANFNKRNCDEKMLLWVLPSALDKLGHACGPNSIEALDLVYHLDEQIRKFINCVNCLTNKRNILWVFTSDHGIAPLPEQMQQKGYHDAHRIIGTHLVEQINQHIHNTFEVGPVARLCEGLSLYLESSVLKKEKKLTRRAIKKEIKRFLATIPGIKQAWTFNELQRAYYPPCSIEYLYKNQLYKGRSADIIIQVEPYSFITNHTVGASHRSPYNYDRHIPLILYRRAHHQRAVIEDLVHNTQLAPTLAHILEVPKPSACTAQVLPGIIFKEDPCF